MVNWMRTCNRKTARGNTRPDTMFMTARNVTDNADTEECSVSKTAKKENIHIIKAHIET